MVEVRDANIVGWVQAVGADKPAVSVPKNATTTLGRNTLATGKLVSKKHITLHAAHDDAVTITDLSSNGTSLNGVRLKRDTPAPLRHADLITLVAEEHQFAFLFLRADQLLDPTGGPIEPSAYVSLRRKLLAPPPGMPTPDGLSVPASRRGSTLSAARGGNVAAERETVAATTATAATRDSAESEGNDVGVSEPSPVEPRTPMLRRNTVAAADVLALPEGTWFYADGARVQHGPVSTRELLRARYDGVIGPESLVWNPELVSTWVSMRSIADIDSEVEAGADDDGDEDDSGGALVEERAEACATSAASSRAIAVTVPMDDATSSRAIPTKEVFELNGGEQGRGKIFTVELERGGGGLGIKLSKSNRVTEVRAGGAAEREGSIRAGDQIVRVNGQTIAQHEQVDRLLQGGEPVVRLQLSRAEDGGAGPAGDADLAREAASQDVIEVTLDRTAGGLGIGLSASHRVTIVNPRGAAEREGSIRKGDRVVEVNGRELRPRDTIAPLVALNKERVTLKLVRATGAASPCARTASAAFVVPLLEASAETAKLVALAQEREQRRMLDEVGVAEALPEDERDSVDRLSSRQSRMSRPSINVGAGSASMFDSSLRDKVRRISVAFSGSQGKSDSAPAKQMESQLEAIQREHRLSSGHVRGAGMALDSIIAESGEEDDGYESSDVGGSTTADSTIHSTTCAGPLLPLAVLLGRSDGTGRSMGGAFDQAQASREVLLAALTSPTWRGVSMLMAVHDFSGWDPPEYHSAISTLLCCYRAYTSPSVLFGHLSSIYTLLVCDAPLQSESLSVVAERALYVLCTWARDHPADFAPPVLDDATSFSAYAGRKAASQAQRKVPGASSVVTLLAAFDRSLERATRLVSDSDQAVVEARECSPTVSSKSSGKLDVGAAVATGRKLVARATSFGRNRQNSDGGGGASPAAVAANGDGFLLTDLWARLLAAPLNERSSVRELAMQLALFERSIFCAIPSIELQRLAFAKADKALSAPHVMSMCAHFNRMSRWVCEQIVRQEQLKDRVRVLRLMIELARASRQLLNYNGVMEIVAALHSASIGRLRHTWERLPASSQREFEELEALLKADRSHAALRAAMRETANMPAVPYLGLYLSDLTFIEDGNADYSHQVGDGQERLVNLTKCQMIGKAVGEVLRFQRVGYDAKPSEPVFKWLRSLSPPLDEEVYELSLQIEPRDGGGLGEESTSAPRRLLSSRSASFPKSLSIRSKSAPNMKRKQSIPEV